ncbi:MAG: hypothetical protein AVDCRST_MAG66-103, partial [uncultured Pseudonocardia sp.]
DDTRRDHDRVGPAGWTQHHRPAGLDPGQRRPADPAHHRGDPAVARRPRRQRRRGAPQRRPARRAGGTGHRRVRQRPGDRHVPRLPHHGV